MKEVPGDCNRKLVGFFNQLLSPLIYGDWSGPVDEKRSLVDTMAEITKNNPI